MEIDELASILHNCGINAYSGPSSQSVYEWNIYRENIAKVILNMCEVTKKAVLTNAMHSDGEGDAVLEGDVYYIEHVDAESVVLTRRQ